MLSAANMKLILTFLVSGPMLLDICKVYHAVLWTQNDTKATYTMCPRNEAQNIQNNTGNLIYLRLDGLKSVHLADLSLASTSLNSPILY
jgi:hypothetical protein